MRAKDRCLLVVTLGLILSLLMVPACWSAGPGGDAPGRYIVVFKGDVTDAAWQSEVIWNTGGQALRALPLVNGMAAALPPGIEKQLARRAGVERVEVDAVVNALGGKGKGGGSSKTPPPQNTPWGVDRIDAEWAWATSTGAGIKVAVIDTGIDGDHPDLSANVQGGVNFVGKNWVAVPDPNAWDDDNGHGSHVAGIIAAVDNEIGVVGVAPDASLYAVKVLGRSGSGYTSDVISGIEWAILQGMDIANMSLGSDYHVQALQDACDAAADAGVLLVAAAGNDGEDVDYPAAYSSVIAVAATSLSDAVASWSSCGSQVYIAAPGVEIPSTWKSGKYNTIGGTSMAAPHVSGALALALAAGMPVDLCLSADDIGPAGDDIYSGCGLVDAGEAVTGSANYGDNLP